MFFQISGMVASSLLWPRVVRRGGFRAMLRIWSGFSFVLPLAALGTAWFLPMPFYLVLFFFLGAVVSARTVSRDAVTVELSTEENRPSAILSSLLQRPERHWSRSFFSADWNVPWIMKRPEGYFPHPPV